MHKDHSWSLLISIPSLLLSSAILGYLVSVPKYEPAFDLDAILSLESDSGVLEVLLIRTLEAFGIVVRELNWHRGVVQEMVLVVVEQGH